jgi:uncharacterized protein (UPF0335 family)
MARKNQTEEQALRADEETVATDQPSELKELKALTKEFIDKLQYIENEISTLTEDRKDLFSEYKNKLDLKTLKAAIRVVKIKNSVSHRDTFDTFVHVLDPEDTED